MGHKIKGEGMMHLQIADGESQGQEFYLVIKTESKICCLEHLKEMAIKIMARDKFASTPDIVAFMTNKPVEDIKKIMQEVIDSDSDNQTIH